MAAVCVWPDHVKHARQRLGRVSTIGLATVINFPHGSDSTKISCEQTGQAIEDGATEIDYVMPYRQLMAGNVVDVESALSSVRRCVPDSIHLKVILETGELQSSQSIRLASNLAIDQGADFIKTSTGKVAKNATLNAAQVMLDVIDKKNRNVGFKPAGGIRTVVDAESYLSLAEEKLGESWCNAAHFRLGASSLLQDALSLAEDA